MRSKPEEFVLPEWCFRLIRPPLKQVWRLLFKIKYKNIENIPQRSSGLIIAANHQTYIDPFWLSIPIRRPIRFLAWDVVFSWPVVGKLIELFGAWPLQIEGSDPAAIRRTLQWLREGGAVGSSRRWPRSSERRNDALQGRGCATCAGYRSSDFARNSSRGTSSVAHGADHSTAGASRNYLPPVVLR